MLTQLSEFLLSQSGAKKGPIFFFLFGERGRLTSASDWWDSEGSESDSMVAPVKTIVFFF